MHTGLDMTKLAETGQWLTEQVLGRPNGAKVRLAVRGKASDFWECEKSQRAVFLLVPLQADLKKGQPQQKNQTLWMGVLGLYAQPGP